MGQQKPPAANRAARRRQHHPALREILAEIAGYPMLIPLIEARILLGLTDWRARSLITTGQLHSIRQGSGTHARVVIARSEVRRFLIEGAR
jgi:hypothetical protein